MRQPIPRVQVEWLKLSDRWQEVMVISEPTSWISHFDVQLRRTRRCGGSTCYPCATGAQRQLRVVIMVVDGRGKDFLLELRERHREMFDRYESMVGLRLRIRKFGTASNSPVEVKPIEFAAAVERDIGRLVESLGLPAIHAQLPSSIDLIQEQIGSTSQLERELLAPSLESDGGINA